MMKRIAIALLLALPLAPPAAAQAAPPPSIPAQASQLDFLQELTRKTERRIANANQTPELRGSGPNPARMELDLALPNATIYRPADLTTLGSRKLGVLIWGNGGCSNDGASARAHLAEIASHGYLVVAPGRSARVHARPPPSSLRSAVFLIGAKRQLCPTLRRQWRMRPGSTGVLSQPLTHASGAALMLLSDRSRKPEQSL